MHDDPTHGDPTAQVQGSAPLYRIKLAEPTNPNWQVGWEVEYEGPDPGKGMEWVRRAHEVLTLGYPRAVARK
jgi:hypothetical protein